MIATSPRRRIVLSLAAIVTALALLAVCRTDPVRQTAAGHVRCESVSRTPRQAPSRLSTPEQARSAAFAQTRPGVFEATGPGYHARVTAADGLTYSPSQDAALRLKLHAVRRGDDELCSLLGLAADSPARLDPDGWLRIARSGGLEERYLARGDGIEQLFVLARPLPGTGDLRFSLEVGARGLRPAAPRTARHGGVPFTGRDGAVAVRYGQIVVRDAAQRSITVEPEMQGDAQIAFTLPERWLRAARYPVVVDPLVGNNMVLSPSSTVSNTVAAPTVAAGSNNFLVAWVDYGAGTDAPVMAGVTVSQSGLASSAFAMSASDALPRLYRSQRIENASDGTNWLVVWSDGRSSGGGIRGSIVTSSGSVQGGSDFLIASTAGTIEEDPLVAFNGTDYLVAWQDVPAGSSSGQQAYFTRVTTGGVVGTAQAVPSVITPRSQSLLFLSAQKSGGDTLLLYRENGEQPALTRSIRVATSGDIRDPGGTSLFKQDMEDNGYGKPIGVAFVSTEWHVLSSFDQTVDSSVFLHKINTDGQVTPPQGIFTSMGLGPIGSTADNYAPVFAGTDEWLFVRNERVTSNVYHLLGKRVTFDGEDKDPVPFQIDTATTGVLRNGVAAQSGNYFLAAWLDGRGASTQPGDAANIVAAIIDTTYAGKTDTPLVATVTASPTSGEKPLTVSFGSALSQGSYDTLKWDFGDGATSTEAAVSHTYGSNGTYVAQLTLTNGAYKVYDAVLITVGTGVGSDESTQLGVPIENSPGMVTRLFLNGVYVALNFKDGQEDKDAVRVSGVWDLGSLPDDLTGVLGSVSVGSYATTFSLDANGAYKSDAGKNPVTLFSVSPKTGSFIFQQSNANLKQALEELGAKNEDVKSADKKIVNVPISVTIGEFSATAIAGAKYVAVTDNTGTATFIFLSTGDEVSGAFYVTKFAANESVKAQQKVHRFTISGLLVRPNGEKFIPSSTGEFVFSVGNYNTRVPAAQFIRTDGNVKFAVKKTAAGLTKFSLTSKSVFSMQIINIPAEATDGSGMPIAKSGDNIVKVDLNLSLQLDMSDGARLNAGRFVPIERKNADAKAWKLRIAD